MGNELNAELLPIYSAQNNADLLQASEKVAKAIGFSTFSMLARTPRPQTSPQVDINSTVQANFVQHYLASQYVDIDPRVSYVMGEKASPMIWSSSLYESERGERLYAEAAAVGVRSGVVIPIALPSQRVMVTLNVDVDLNSASRRQEVNESLGRSVLLALALHDQGRVIALQSRRSGRMENPLTPRERECLYWVSRGKTSGEIATIISLSESTTNFHISNAVRKLNVTNRTQAVSRAVAERLIEP